MTTTEALETVAPETLTAADRCDTCSAQAYVIASFVTGELYFCAHHWNANKDKMKDVLVAVHDETHRLNK